MRHILTALLLLTFVFQGFVGYDSIIIKGKITDENGAPLAGAAVTVKGAKIGTLTDSRGFFSLAVDSNARILVVTEIGFETKEVKIESYKGELVIKLRPQISHLDEVVVTGIASNRKTEVTGAVTTVTAKDLKTGISYPLQGKAAGVYVQGAPGESKTIKIRGMSTLKNKSALYGAKSPGDSLYSDDFEREGYDQIIENRFLKAIDNPLSTFSIDVDAASYSNVRRFLEEGRMPPAGAVRIEEMINYFTYDYSQPVGKDPFSITTEVADCPWNKKHQLMLIGLQGKKIPVENLPASNLVFLIDVSGSMMDEDKLPLVKASLKLLVDQIREQDRVAIVVYAGAAGLVLPSTLGNEKVNIKAAIDRLEAGGSTAGGAGIKLAYQVARSNFISGGNNRVILCTDGDFNVGASSDDAMERLIEEERKSGVFLTVLGYGQGNYQDAKMQKLADKGNGNHAYIDQLMEAKKVLVSEFGGTLFTIAKDVKLQIEFNPAKVQGYRLIGYENRMLNKEDFNNDKKDAGDLGSGHSVTALYEIIPVGVKTDLLEKVDALKYQSPGPQIKVSANGELATIKFRFKQPDGDTSKLIEKLVTTENKEWKTTSNNFRFASAVAQLGLLLRDSEFKGRSNYDLVRELAGSALGKDEQGYRKDFLKLLQRAVVVSKHHREISNDDDDVEPTR